MEQLVSRPRVMHVGSGGHQAMHQTRSIYSNMEFHAQVPLLPLPGLLHLPITFSTAILRCRRRRNHAGIQNLPRLQPLLCPMLLDGLKQHLAQSTTFQQVRAVDNGGRGWHRGATEPVKRRTLPTS